MRNETPDEKLERLKTKARRNRLMDRDTLPDVDVRGHEMNISSGGTICNESCQSIARPEVQAQVLELLRSNPVMSSACREVGVSYDSFLKYRESTPDFSHMVDIARLEGIEAVEFEAWEQAKDHDHKNHRLVEFLLKGRKRDVYGDRLDVRSQSRAEVVINLIPPEDTERIRRLQAGEVVEGELIEEEG